MICPHCQQDSFEVHKVWLNYYFEQTCPKCGKKAKLKRSYRLAILSGLSGFSAIAIPLFLIGNTWYLIPFVAATLCGEYVIMSKYRALRAI